MGEGTVFPQSLDLLIQLKHLHYHLTLASHNPHAQFFCDRYGFSDHIDHVVAFAPQDYEQPTKHSHLLEIMNYYQTKNLHISYKEMVLIDDRSDVINHTKNTLPEVSYIQVNALTGLVSTDINHLLHK